MKIKFAILVMPLIFLIIPGVLAVQGSPVQDHHAADQHCDNATEFVTVSTTADTLAYDPTEIKVSKNTCVQIKFANTQTQPHDFSIDHDEGNEFEEVHMHLDNNTAGHMGDNFLAFNVSTPDLDITYDFYCSVVGHRDAGMEGKLVVGDGTPAAPGFEIFAVLVGFFTIGTVVVLKRRM
ncbi:MAG: Loki-CTERM sorting domain-containing protein [Candidatus Hodarchaeales archaeon]|jgi:uncharacterized cupredoxin-like copper-binding protein